jgi:hypothetical protein
MRCCFGNRIAFSVLECGCRLSLVFGGTVRGVTGGSEYQRNHHVKIQSLIDPTVRATTTLVLNSVQIECRTTVFWDTFESRFHWSGAEAVSFLDRDCGHARGRVAFKLCPMMAMCLSFFSQIKSRTTFGFGLAKQPGGRAARPPAFGAGGDARSPPPVFQSAMERGSHASMSGSKKRCFVRVSATSMFKTLCLRFRLGNEIVAWSNDH